MQGGWKIVVGLLVVGAAVAVGISFLDSPEGETVAWDAAKETETAQVETQVSSPDLSTKENGEENRPTRAVELLESAEDVEETPDDPKGPVSPFLAGTVVNDRGDPVAGAEVRYHLPTRGAMVISVSGTPLEEALNPRTTTTDANGKFRFENIALASARELVVDHQDYVLFRRGRLTGTTRGIDLGVLTLEAGAAISGTVVGPDGRPIEGATVWFEADLRKAMQSGGAFVIHSNMMGGPGDRSVETDAEGRYRLTGVEPGFGNVVAQADGMTRAKSSSLELAAGQEEFGVHVQLSPGKAIAGRVLDTDGKPLAGAEVSFSGNRSLGSGMMIMTSSSGKALDTVETDAEGRFQSKPLDDGAYTVTADAEGFSKKKMRTVVAGGEPIEIHLSLSGEAIGRVLESGTQRPIANAKVKISAATNFGGLGLDIDPSHFVGELQADAHTDENGVYRIADVDAGEYTVKVEAEGYPRTASDKFVVLSGAATPEVTVLVPIGASLAGIVRDGAGNPVANAEVAAEPQRQGSHFEGEDGVFIRMEVSDDLGTSREFSGGHRKTVQTDKDGSFRILGLGQGTYTLRASHSSFATGSLADLQLSEGEAKQNLEMRMTAGGSVEGMVYDMNGAPSSGDTITLKPQEGTGRRLRGITDAEGYYLIERVPPGEYIAERVSPSEADSGGMMVHMVGFSKTDQSGKHILVNEGEVLQVNFSEIEKPLLRGVVKSAAGVVEGARVSLYRVEDEGEDSPGFRLGADASVETDSSGSYVMANLQPGTYDVEVLHPQALIPARDTLELHAGSPMDQDYFLEGGTVQGRIVATDGTGLADATVTLEEVREEEGSPERTRRVEMVMFSTSDGDDSESSTMISSGGSQTVRTDANGNYSIEFVPDGSYQLSASHPQFVENSSDTFEMKDHAESKGNVLELAMGGSMLITLRTGEERRLAPHRPVQAEGPNGETEFAISNPKGEVSFRGLVPGEWTVKPLALGQNSGEIESTTIEVKEGREAKAELDV